MGRRAVQHHGIEGSAALATQPVSPVPAEALASGEMRRLPFAGELLGAARVRSSFVAVPLDAFDEAGPALMPEEQAAYLHLIRLSYGEGRNWCRVGKRELQTRLHASERRLLRILDGLVRKRFARPLQRDNRGTLWRVYLPREAAGEAVGDDVLLGRPSQLAAVPDVLTADGAPAAAPPAEAPVRRERSASREAARPEAPARRAPPKRAVPPASAASAGPLARALAEARGALDEEGLATAAREVAELLGEGQSVRRIRAAIDAIHRRTPTSNGSTP